MNAAQELHEYRHRLAAEALKEKERSPSAAPTRVGITINHEARTSSTIFFYDNVESGLNGWTSQALSGSDLWHQTTLQASSPTHSWWPGIESQMNYSNGLRVNDALISPPVALTGAIGPIRLLFAENYVTEAGWDFCMVDVSSDGGSTWNPLRGGYGSAPSGDSKGWTISTLDLTAYAGQTINLRFLFDTGDSLYNAFPGWFVDDIVIFDQGGTITGKKFFDVNNNSVKDPGERGIKEWLITAAGPITLTTRTDYRGKYRLPLPLGTYTVSETFEPNWTQTYPLSGTWSVTLATPDTVADSVHFGNYIHASFINGVTFNDLNHNGVNDAGDTLVANWRILLEDTLGNQIDYDYSDSLGQYQLYIFQPGTYVVKEVPKAGWIESYPAGESYKINVPDLSQFITGIDFGNYYSPLTSAIVGQKFDDRNRNHQQDTLELGLPGFKINLWRKGNGINYNLYRQRTTDSGGYYQFLSLPADTYKVVESPQEGWWQSVPDSFYIVMLDSGGLADNVNFGNYQIAPGSIGGLNFNDLNGNGIVDSGETGLSGWSILLSGTTYFQSTANLSATTDNSGNFVFSGIWPGTYTISEVWRSHWKQTVPAHLQPNFVSLGVEQNLTGLLFGNKVDSSFSVSFRTFLPESLALAADLKGKHLPVKLAPVRDSFCLSFVNAETTAVRKLTIVFGIPVQDSLQLSEPGIQLFNDKFTRVEITFFTPIDTGDDVQVWGITKKPKLEKVSRWFWTFDNLKRSVVKTTATFTCNDLLYPMPNALNLVQQVGGGLRVGLGGPHSVVAGTYKDVIKSLVIGANRMHIGDPRCLGRYATNLRSIKKQVRYLTPTQGNNKLFAEMIAFKANIIGSDAGFLPGGFGNLIFDDGTGPGHPLNGMPLRTIAAAVDSFMSSFKDTGLIHACEMPPSLAGLDSASLYLKLRMIDSAFSGPVDTVGFYDGLEYTPVRPLTDVPFLRLDTSSVQRAYVSLRSLRDAIPDQFSLFQNYPNPFNPSTQIDFYLPTTSIVTLKVYNTLGQEVATLVDRQELEDGSHQYELSTTTVNLASGVYYYRLVAETVKSDENPTSQTFVSVKKMVLLK